MSTRLTRVGYWTAAAIGLVLAANAVRLAINRPRDDSAVAPIKFVGEPHTIVLKTVTYDPGIEPRSWWEQTHAVRSDGSLVRRDYTSRSGSPQIRRWIYLAEGLTITIDDVAELRSSVPGPPHPAASRLRDPASQCMNSLMGRKVPQNAEFAGDAQIADLDTYRIISRSARGVVTNYFAPALGCGLVYARFDPTGEARYQAKELLRISTGEPDATLFDVPQRYREVPPSALADVDPSSAQAALLDRGYHQARRAQ